MVSVPVPPTMVSTLLIGRRVDDSWPNLSVSEPPARSMVALIACRRVGDRVGYLQLPSRLSTFEIVPVLAKLPRVSVSAAAAEIDRHARA